MPLSIETFSPMLVAYLESRRMLSSRVPLDKILRETGMLPLSFLTSSSMDIRETTMNYCPRDIQNQAVMRNASSLFLIRANGECACINSSLVPVQVSYEKSFDNPTSMCFQRSCQDPTLRQSYNLTDLECTTQCEQMRAWMNLWTSSNPPNDFDVDTFHRLCDGRPSPPEPEPSPSPPEPSPVKPLDVSTYWIWTVVGGVSVVVLILVILNYFFRYKRRR